jgi:miniconductance mechanosensitive channel
MNLTNWLTEFFNYFNADNQTILYGTLVINFIFLFVLVKILDAFAKKILIHVLQFLADKTASRFDDLLIKNKTAKYVAHIFPLLLVYKTVPVIMRRFIEWELLFIKGVKIYIIILLLWTIRSIFKTVRDYLKELPRYSDKPIDSYIQVIMIVLWMLGFSSVIFILFELKFFEIVTAFGSVSAVLLFIFKDSIMGFVASISVSVNDIVRIGDWITSEKFGADGDVIEINLATVKVRNFDNTTTTIPTYSLISDSFKNWRGMIESNGRRIKRHVLLKTKSVRFLEKEELKKYSEIQYMNSYINHRQSDIDKHNTTLEINKNLLLNGRNLTNLGLFRKFIQEYISHHPGINKDMIIMVRHLQPTEKGIPLEVYCFSNDKVWENYEHIMADIFDHIIASVTYFDLELFELNFEK